VEHVIAVRESPRVAQDRLLRLHVAVRPAPELVEPDPQRQLGDLPRPRLLLYPIKLARINLVKAQLSRAGNVERPAHLLPREARSADGLVRRLVDPP